MSPRKVLRDLLCDIFNAQELRRFVDYNVDRALTAELREQVSLRELAGDVVELLDRRGLVDGHLFESLIAEVPGQRDAIAAAAEAWRLAPAPAPAPMIPADAAGRALLLNRYREHLAAAVGKIDLRALPGLSGRPASIDRGLDDAFVAPELSVGASNEKCSLARLLSRERRVVVQGEPGAGKSTLLRAICLTLADRASAIGRHLLETTSEDPMELLARIPVFLRLADLPAIPRGPGQFERAIREALGSTNSAEIADAAMTELREGRALVCLDGLDEVAEDLRLPLARAIEGWARTSLCACWVSTRPQGSIVLDGFARADLGSFSDRQIVELILRREHARGLNPDEARRCGEEWLYRVASAPTHELLRVPLLLELALDLHDLGKVLPIERVALYEGVVQALVHTWNRDRLGEAALRRGSGEALDPELVIESFADVLLALYEGDELGRSLHRGRWRRALAEHLGRGAAVERQAVAVIEILSTQAGLLVQEGSDGLRLWHISLGAYLAATALARRAWSRPQLVVGPAGSVQGREIVLMAVAWTRSVAGAPTIATDLVEALVDGSTALPWSRLFGVPLQVAVECVRDGLMLDDRAFTRLVTCSIEQIERVPTATNRRSLRLLGDARPRYEPGPTVEARIRGLLSVEEPLLDDEDRVTIFRWIANLVDRSPAARAMCEAAIDVGEAKGWGSTARLWAALGLLRAGVVDSRACLLVANAITSNSSMTNSIAKLREGLHAGERETDTRRRERYEALRLLLDPAPTSANAKVGDVAQTAQTRGVAALVLAILGEIDEVVIEIIVGRGRQGLRSMRRSAHVDERVARGVLVALAPRSALVRRWLAAALWSEAPEIEEPLEAIEIDPPSALPHAALASEVLVELFRTPATADVAAGIVHAFLAASGPALLDAVSLLDVTSIHRGTPHDTLRTFIRTGVVTRDALLRLTDVEDVDPRVHWVIAAEVWGYCARYRMAGPSDGFTRLLAALDGENLVCAVISAGILEVCWDLLDTGHRRHLVRTWVRGLTGAGLPPSRPERSNPALLFRHHDALPVDPIALAAWHELKNKSPLDAEGRREIVSALASESPLQRALAASLFLEDTEFGMRCEAILREALFAAEVAPATVALSTLARCGDPDDELLLASLRLALLDHARPLVGSAPASEPLVTAFLDEPAVIDLREVNPYSPEAVWIEWLATNPAAGALAFARLDAADPSTSQRATWLLTAWLTTPERAAELTTKACALGGTLLDRLESAILAREWSGDSPFRKSLEKIADQRAQSEDLAQVHAALHGPLWGFGVRSRVTHVARRLLQAEELYWRLEEVALWMHRRVPRDQRETSAHQWFGVGVEAIADALRPCLNHPDPVLALEAGLRLVHLVEDSEPLRDRARRVLGEVSSVDVPRVDDLTWAEEDEFRWLLRSEAARVLATAMDRPRLSTPARHALLALVDVGDDEAAAPLIQGLLREAEGLCDGWEFMRLTQWISDHRPHWWTELDPLVAKDLARKTRRSIQSRIALRARASLSQTLLAVLAHQWVEFVVHHQAADRTFEIFLGVAATPPLEVLESWRTDLHGDDLTTRTRAAVALAMSGQQDIRVVDGLIDAWIAESAGWKVAFDLMRAPELQDLFKERRRARATITSLDPEGAWGLVNLWGPDEVATEHDVVAALLRTASTHEIAWIAAEAAGRLWRLAPDEGRALLRGLCARSDEAALILEEHDGPDMIAEARLWAMVEGASQYWTNAADHISRRGDARARLLRALLSIWTRVDFDEVIGRIYDLSSEEALRVVLETLGIENPGSFSWHARHTIAAMLLGQRPGRLNPPLPLRHEEPTDALLHARTLEERASALDRIDRADTERRLALPAALARILDRAPDDIDAIWRRACDGSAGPQDIEAIRDLVDARERDTPGQRLARLWWLLQLPSTEILKREERAARRGETTGSGPESGYGDLDGP